MEIGIVMLLRAAWIAATLPILIASVPAKKLKWLHDLMTSFAKRGKTMQSTSNKFTVPQKYFCHFYVLAVLWTTLLLVSTGLYAYTLEPTVFKTMTLSNIASHLTGGSNTFSMHRWFSIKAEHRYGIWRSVFMLMLMEAQVLRRLFESIYVLKYSPSARMHIFGYLAGWFFYTAAPLSVCCVYATEVFSFMVNLVLEFILKGKEQMLVNEIDWWECLNPLMQLRWYTWIGGAIFLWGWIHQLNCHAILASLRENLEQVNDYAIPRGDWFEYVSSPHYLAEIVIYAGLVVASGCSDLTVWLLFVFVVANLVFAAGETHRWYLRKFDDYPKNRFAVLPFVY